MYAMLDVDTAGGAGFPEVSSDWLAHAVRAVAPVFWESAMRAWPFAEREKTGGPLGRPGTLWGEVYVWNPERRLGDPRPLSPESLEWMTRELAEYPTSAHLRLCVLGAEADPELGPELAEEFIRVSLSVDDDWPWVAQLQVVSALSPEREGDTAERSRRWADFLHAAAAKVDPTYGHVCDDQPTLGHTALDRAIHGRSGRVSIRKGRERLRGYSWVTVLPSELARTLGGFAALERSGAFFRVRELPTGAVLLQACEDLADYDDEVMERVFETLAPVLPEGTPEADPTLKGSQRLVWRNARR
ncbi:hypothetical protein ABZ865_12410 [Streptomyces sp. NPDC047085]|uniref:hypothetical protein n=1 Tax=Streptomyces sp. NPDC047085 TaxID=3155140 RepID=UPI0033F24D73